MRIVICGAGDTGRHVAEVLAQVHDVTVVDRRPDRRIADQSSLRFILGDAADPSVLVRAGARDADALIAVTRDDPTNLLIAMLAKHWLGVHSTVVRAQDPAHGWLFTPQAGVDVVVSAAELVARLVQEEVTAGDLVTLLRLHEPGVAVTETTLPPGAAIAGTHAGRFPLPDGVALTAVIRDGAVLLPDRAGPLRAGDVVVALCEPGREHLLHDLLTGTAR
ncbi:MAG TPA: TrkA family potassium uptake protein [Solirubrobacteraceae bacterium]|nr:TrkA family potassium uptake protein [Solirubrobacteraceae bacterium]